MNILMVHPHLYPGGAEKHLIMLSSHLKKLNVDVTIITLSYKNGYFSDKLSNINLILPEDNDYFPIDVYGAVDGLKLTFKEVTGLRKLVKKCYKNYDMILTWNFPSYWTLWKITRVFKIWNSCEIFAPIDESYDAYQNSIIFKSLFHVAKAIDKHIVLKYIDYIVTVSNYNAVNIKKRYGKEAHVIPPGVDFDYYFNNKIGDAKEILGLKDKYVMLHVGRFVRRKNQLLTIKVLKRVKRRIPEAYLILVGDGPYKDKINRLIYNLDLKNSVKILSYVDERMLKVIYYASDLNIYPHVNQSFGLVPFEALICGAPSIVSSDTGAAELISKENIGIICNPTEKEIYEMVIWAYNNPDKLDEIVKRGINYIFNNLTWRNIAIKYREYLRGILNEQ